MFLGDGISVGCHWNIWLFDQAKNTNRRKIAVAFNIWCSGKTLIRFYVWHSGQVGRENILGILYFSLHWKCNLSIYLSIYHTVCLFISVYRSQSVYFSFSLSLSIYIYIYICVCVCWLLSLEMGTVIKVEILGEAVCISLSANTLGKGMDPTNPAMEE